MKKTITKILLLLTISSFFGLNILSNTHALPPPPAASEPIADTSAASEPIKVTVTEKVPGAGCEPQNPASGYTGTYECTIQPGFGTVVAMMGSIIKYFTFIAALGGVLFIVYNGIMYSMGGMEVSLKDDAKKKIIKTLIGLMVLFLAGVILNLVAPWVYVA